MKTTKQYEFECKCGYVWLDDQNYGCPLCQNHEDIIRRDYVIAQPETFNRKYKRGKNEISLPFSKRCS